jgi:hypothetical protein
MRLWKSCPKCIFNTYIHTFPKNSPIIVATFVISPKLPKVNSHPIGENSPNLVNQVVRHHATPCDTMRHSIDPSFGIVVLCDTESYVH